MNFKTLAAAVAIAACTSGAAFAQSGNSGNSGSGGTNVDNVTFSIVGNQVVITADGVVAGTLQIQPGQTAADAIRALLADLETSGGVFGGLQAQALRQIAAANGLGG